MSILGNPLAFTAAYEQIILSQSQSTPTKVDTRQPMNIVCCFFYIKKENLLSCLGPKN